MDTARERAIDELLVLRCQAGSRASFDLLVRRWNRRLWRYARSLTGSDAAAWDVTQEAWVAALKQIRRLNDPAWFGAWACRIVRNKCADDVRRAARRRRLTEALAERQRRTETRRADRSDRMAEAIRRLPQDRRELLALKYGQGLTVIEIAVVLGIPAGTVKSRLHEARDRLKQILEGDES